VIQAANELAAQLTGFSPSELKGRRFVDLIGDVEAHREVLAGLEALTQTGGRRLEQEYPLSRRDGESRQIVWVHTPLREEHSDGTAVLSVGLDVTDRVEAESRMRWLANHDGLTGLVNRHRFVEDLKRTYDQATRGGMVAALLLFDLDHFKEINDTSGHAAGDALLRTVAEELRARSRKSDIVSRLGGDEFAMLMPNTDAYGAAAVARQINERLAQMPFVFASGVIAPVPASGSRFCPSTATIPRSCSRTRTSPCTRPSAPGGPASGYSPTNTKTPGRWRAVSIGRTSYLTRSPRGICSSSMSR
jgi:diguanylate cyclase (GGDEF)-like protein/PAS domain S-box-containing protein